MTLSLPLSLSLLTYMYIYIYIYQGRLAELPRLWGLMPEAKGFPRGPTTLYSGLLCCALGGLGV